jgi:predicted nuclease of predicted toxin-antitoxin system
VKPLYNGMLPPSLVQRLSDLWPDAAHVVREIGLRAPDHVVWARARADGYTIVTKDHDFADPNAFPGPPPRAIRLRIGNATPGEVEEYIRQHAREIETFAASPERYVEI